MILSLSGLRNLLKMKLHCEAGSQFSSNSTTASYPALNSCHVFPTHCFTKIDLWSNRISEQSALVGGKEYGLAPSW